MSDRRQRKTARNADLKMKRPQRPHPRPAGKSVQPKGGRKEETKSQFKRRMHGR